MKKPDAETTPLTVRTDADQAGQQQLVHADLSRRIVGAAMSVLNELRPGLDERIYENALVIELHHQSLLVDQQRRYPVHYRGHLVGTLVPDLVVDGKVIVDPKVVTTFTDDHLAQMLGYLAISGLELAILLNFKFARLQWKRIARSLPRVTGRLTADHADGRG